MLTRDGFVQGYNGQIAVDAAHQIIVAHRLVNNSANYRALVPLIDDVRVHLGRKPREVSGDAGFANEVIGKTPTSGGGVGAKAVFSSGFSKLWRKIATTSS